MKTFRFTSCYHYICLEKFLALRCSLVREDMYFSTQKFDLVTQLLVFPEKPLDITVLFRNQPIHSACAFGTCGFLRSLCLNDSVFYQHFANMRFGKNGTGQTGYAYQILDFDIVALGLLDKNCLCYHFYGVLASFLLPLDEGFRYCSLHFSAHPFQLILVWIQTGPHFFSHFHK